MQEWLEEVRGRFGWTVLLITHDIREAVFLSDRVLVLSPRPARVARVVRVDLPRPREVDVLTDPAFAAAEAELLDTLRGGTRL
jgi:ABC-type nitrate/sulfonate/bicarbonate transport system ATPase subunit